MPARAVSRKLVTIIALGFLPAGCVTDQDKASQAVQDPCQGARYLKLLTDKLTASYKDKGTAAQNAAKAEFAYAIAAAKSTERKTQIALKAMQAVTEAQIPTFVTQTVSYNENLAKARETLKIHEAMQMSEHLAATKEITLTPATHNNGGATHKGTSGISLCKTEAKITYQAPNCSLESDADNVKAENVNAATTDKIVLSTTDNTQPVLTLTALAKGTVTGTTAASASEPGACIENSNDFDGGSNRNNAFFTKVEHKGHTFKSTSIPLSKEGDNSKCPDDDKSSVGHQYKQTTLAQAICNTRKAKLPSFTPLHRQELSQLVSNTQLIQALADLDNPGAEVPTGEAAKQTLVHKYFGATSEIFKQTITDAIDKTKIDIKIRNTAIQKTPFDLAGTADGVTVLAYYLGKAAAAKGQLSASEEKLKQSEKTEKTEESKDGDNKTNASDCTGAEEGKCDKEKWTWDKEKKECKVKEGAAVISYVMNAPLLLAFFFLA
uniref:Variant surface glycoprotein 530 n=1 Tax=Trypanosoma brucei TaxID=5691 RepID=M4SX94_9TRYP|nr:variant surface glycoprotein 530 [Trypanosoma brucei]